MLAATVGHSLNDEDGYEVLTDGSRDRRPSRRTMYIMFGLSGAVLIGALVVVLKFAYFKDKSGGGGGVPNVSPSPLPQTSPAPHVSPGPSQPSPVLSPGVSPSSGISPNPIPNPYVQVKNDHYTINGNRLHVPTRNPSPATSSPTSPRQVDASVAVVGEFLGIQYSDTTATTPIRFKACQEPSYTSSIMVNALAYGDSCPQGPFPYLNETFARQDEHGCLTLNIWAPMQADGRPQASNTYPVMVYLHGGGTSLEVGDSSSPLYNGTSLAGTAAAEDKGRVIVVTVNSRVGLLGYFDTAAFQKPVNGEQHNNWGFTDQQTALKWIQKNIAMFGGDPKRVTLFGQSGGGYLTLLHMISPISRPLFQQAIVQSGVGVEPGWYTATQEESKLLSTTAAENLNCTTLQCMQQLPVSAFTVPAIQENCYWLPSIDPSILPMDIPTAAAQNGFAAYPLLIGSVQEEASLGLSFIAQELGLQVPMSILAGEQLLLQQLRQLTPPLPEEVLNKVYPEYGTDGKLLGSPFTRVSTIWSDLQVKCPSFTIANQLAATNPKVLQYSFQVAPSTPIPQLYPSPYPLGAYHGSDLPFVFGTEVDFSSNATMAKTRDLMQGAWTEFAHSATVSSTWGAPSNASTIVAQVTATGIQWSTSAGWHPGACALFQQYRVARKPLRCGE